MQQWLKDLNDIYVNEKSMHENDYNQEGFEWLDISKTDDCVLIWKRQGKKANNHLIVVGNFDQQTFVDYAIPVKQRNHYIELLNSDAEKYFGSGILNSGPLKPYAVEVESDPETSEKQTKFELMITIPPLSIMVFKPVVKLRRSKAVGSKQ